MLLIVLGLEIPFLMLGFTEFPASRTDVFLWGSILLVAAVPFWWLGPWVARAALHQRKNAVVWRGIISGLVSLGFLAGITVGLFLALQLIFDKSRASWPFEMMMRWSLGAGKIIFFLGIVPVVGIGLIHGLIVRAYAWSVRRAT